MAQPKEPASIKGWHAHVYFNEQTLGEAEALCDLAAKRFPGLKQGRIHQRPVGPHPDWSCQLAFRAALFGDVISWLTLNRGGLTVFIHPITGQELIDHRDRAIWMGEIRPLDLSALPETSEDDDNTMF
ncbi:dioxygenase [Marinobacter halodurans]|uniref:Dioxygenase n=1 Tax=Marinobacter halodurans TaxID=2528979 RepID=A0ABY1ZNQ5_9GAMM|nr:DOPA 4,5-dioxygenase family protein [Marinobacter halodurans]TBW58167.1 dioxygenase [Marinobacter halodurans]